MLFFVRKRSILSSLKNIPYNDITKINKIPKKNFVLIAANVSRPLDNFREKTWVRAITDTTKITSASIENNWKNDVIIKNQNDTPKVVANALNLGEDSSILNRIYQSDQSTLR